MLMFRFDKPGGKLIAVCDESELGLCLSDVSDALNEGILKDRNTLSDFSDAERLAILANNLGDGYQYIPTYASYEKI